MLSVGKIEVRLHLHMSHFRRIDTLSTCAVVVDMMNLNDDIRETGFCPGVGSTVILREILQ
jgi:hypothetical protein